VKPVEVSGTKKKEYLKTKIDELENKRERKIYETCVGKSVTVRRVTI